MIHQHMRIVVYLFILMGVVQIACGQGEPSYAEASVYAETASAGESAGELAGEPAYAGGQLQRAKQKTYCNPMDINYRYNYEQLNDSISYRSGADPVIVNHKGEYFLFV